MVIVVEIVNDGDTFLPSLLLDGGGGHEMMKILSLLFHLQKNFSCQ